MPLLGSIDLCTSSATSQITGYRLAEALAAIRRSGCVGVCRGRPPPPYANDSENRLRLLAVILAVIAPGSGGDGWESNPPRTPQQRPQTVLKTAGRSSVGVQTGPLRIDPARPDSRMIRRCPPVSVTLAVFLAVVEGANTHIGGPKFPQCEPTRRIQRGSGPAVRRGRYPNRRVCRGHSRVRRRARLAPYRRDLDRGRLRPSEKTIRRRFGSFREAIQRAALT